MFKNMKKRIEDGEQQQNNNHRTPINPQPRALTPINPKPRASTPPSTTRKVLSSTPKKPLKAGSNTTPMFPGHQDNNTKKRISHSLLNSATRQQNVGRIKTENKWERRRLNTTASLTSSRESLYSQDSSATAHLSRISYNGQGESSYSTIDTPIESPMIIERVCLLFIF